KVGTADLDRALAAHLCRCTGWRTVYDAIAHAAEPTPTAPARRDPDAAARRAALEGGAPQRVGADIPLGGGGFADDLAPREALVAVPLPPGSDAPSREAAGLRWVLADTLLEARGLAAKVQGRRTTIDERSPLPLPPLPGGGVRLATGWVEPAYLEPDASWCEPGREPATPLANGGAFGGKESSPVAAAARQLADGTGRTVRVVLSREDVVRIGPKRPPMAASAIAADGRVTVAGSVAGGGLSAFLSPVAGWPYRIGVEADWELVDVPGPPVADHLRAVGLAEHAVLVEGALSEAGVDRSERSRDERAAAALLDTCAPGPGESGALAGARVDIDPASGAVERLHVRVAAGDPLDEVVLRSYATGAAHMALGWVLSEGIAVDPATGEAHDLTIRSFGVIRAKDTPPIEIEIVDDPGPPQARASDAVFAAVAAATWNAVTDAEGARPESFPARETRAARRLRR
ncbi:MAG TPA: molybdopterin cofactor-binding domain-containing protein, partial [Actinomycetota bacterium]|nr:molybdopterin cofactor-binding domain-containing protein [Actinomycetota bacterium]